MSSHDIQTQAFEQRNEHPLSAISPAIEQAIIDPPAEPKKKSTKLCKFNDCKDRPVKIIGSCRYCEFNYCSRHRLPESHACSNLVDCRLDASNRLSSKLLNEKCVAAKV